MTTTLDLLGNATFSAFQQQERARLITEIAVLDEQARRAASSGAAAVSVALVEASAWRREQLARMTPPATEPTTPEAA